MTPSLGSRLKSAWNAFRNKNPTEYRYLGNSFSNRPDRPRLTRGNEKSIVNAVYNRIALDCAAINMQHVRLDENNRFLEVIQSGLNNCLTLSANTDQTGRAFMQDVVLSLLDEGCVALVPVDTDNDPFKGSFDILTMRTAKIVQWYPDYVKVDLYNEEEGRKKEVELPKSSVAIVENPLYAVINEQNSTMQRLIRKLNLLDMVDEQNASTKLDLIIQLPYMVKTENKRIQAENRRKEIENQLVGSKYGIAYIDGTEHITQLNRAVENKFMEQVEYLTKMLYSQLGLTTEVMNGTADERVMINYYNRTIEPIMSAIADEMKRKFLTKTARTQGQTIMFFRDPFKLVPVDQIAEIADKMTRNEIMSSNEFRQIIGMKPSDNPDADALRNKNLNAPESAMPSASESDDGNVIDEMLSSLEASIDDIISGVEDEDEEEETEEVEEEA